MCVCRKRKEKKRRSCKSKKQSISLLLLHKKKKKEKKKETIVTMSVHHRTSIDMAGMEKEKLQMVKEPDRLGFATKVQASRPNQHQSA